MAEPAAPAATSSDVLAMLRRHYLPEGRQPGGVFAPEIEAPAVHRRADLIWMPVTLAGRGGLVGHEIKVSRADVLAELADPTKCDAWARYCTRWWLVVADPVLVDGLDLPPTWGVMGPPSGRRTRSMTVLHPAPALTPVDPAPAYATIARWLHWRHDAVSRDLAAEKRYRAEAQERMRRAEAAAPRPSPNRDAAAAIAAEVVARLGGVAGAAHPGVVGDWSRRVSVDDVVTALVDLGQLYEQARRVEWAADRAVRAHRALVGSLDERAVAALATAAAAIPEKRTA